MLCEIDPSARAVLHARFPGVPVEPDIARLGSLDNCDILTAGFPCQDLSQAGLKSGIAGGRSSIVHHVFKLLRRKATRPEWIFFENVSYMIRLHGGAAMTYLTEELSRLGYRWAYRVTDARSFGIPQRRQRVLLLASQSLDPGRVLFSDNYLPKPDLDQIKPVRRGAWYGFYWTEGRRGIGWATEAVPTIKGGSSLGIASPPAVWVSDQDFVGTPTIGDAERLQGFTAEWTMPALLTDTPSKGSRWRLVGNAMCVPMARWLAHRIPHPGELNSLTPFEIPAGTWPLAAFGYGKHAFGVRRSMWPLNPGRVRLGDFLDQPLTALSVRAVDGFLDRASDSVIRYPAGFLRSVRVHANRMRRSKPTV
jgi:DNA (cytosine-5)-methyltransferase 1